jgi:hypothetical protein
LPIVFVIPNMYANAKYLRGVYKNLQDTRLVSKLDTSAESFKEFEDAFNAVTPTEASHEVLRDAVRYFYMTNRPSFERWMTENRQRHLALWADCGLATRVLGLDGIAFLRWNSETKRYEVTPHQRLEETLEQLKAEAVDNLQRKRYQPPRQPREPREPRQPREDRPAREPREKRPPREPRKPREPREPRQ